MTISPILELQSQSVSAEMMNDRIERNAKFLLRWLIQLKESGQPMGPFYDLYQGHTVYIVSFVFYF